VRPVDTGKGHHAPPAEWTAQLKANTVFAKSAAHLPEGAWAVRETNGGRVAARPYDGTGIHPWCLRHNGELLPVHAKHYPCLCRRAA
jgi:hypothetical protein